MGTHLDLHHNGSLIRFDADVLEPFEPRLFDVAWLKSEGHHQGSAAGRGDAHFLEFRGRQMVLRAFLRGGLIRKITRDLFFRLGCERSRALREFALLSWMREQDLPVPRVVAARLAWTGPFYRAAIITERIPDARPLEDLLIESALSPDIWHKVGDTVRRMHAAGVYHSDLNRRNILVDGSRNVWLIDFDKCTRRAPGSWQNENLQRLHRSLSKQGPEDASLNWSDDDWCALMSGYNAKGAAE